MKTQSTSATIDTIDIVDKNLRDALRQVADAARTLYDAAEEDSEDEPRGGWIIPDADMQTLHRALQNWTIASQQAVHAISKHGIAAKKEDKNKDLRSSLEAVVHQLRHGEASEGERRDLRWCANSLEDVIKNLGK